MLFAGWTIQYWIRSYLSTFPLNFLKIQSGRVEEITARGKNGDLGNYIDRNQRPGVKLQIHIRLHFGG